MELQKVKKIYMIGIKGVGMTMLAQFFAGNGIEVLGSDTDEVFMTDSVLKKTGIKVIEGFSETNVPKDADLIIYSSSYNSQTNPEVAKAVSGKTKAVSYAIALGEVFNQKYGIAVVGSHGKTTTTAWLGFVLDRVGIKPNVMVGSVVPQFSGSSLVSQSNYLVVEADEYQNKLQYYNPRAVLLNNIEYDHPDYFSTIADYENVFIEFIKKIPSKGFLIANFDDPVIKKIARVNCRGRVISYAINEKADFTAYEIHQQDGQQFFKVKMVVDDEQAFSSKLALEDFERSESELGSFSIKLSGTHNIYNALAVIAASIELGAELVDIRKALSEFIGTARRMEKMGEYNGAVIIDDYAHHPTEIKATLNGIRQLYPANHLKVVFHPHTYTRTLALIDDFASSFALADEIIVLDIYGSAREKQGGVHSKELIEKIKINYPNKKVEYLPTLKDVENYLRNNLKRKDVVVLMGAGDVFRVGERLIKNNE